MTDVSRRRLLTMLALSPFAFSRPVFAGAAIAPVVDRIIAIEWLPMEMLFILGVKPLAVAEPASYMTLVQQPPVPEGCADVGLRTEPNLELMTELNPELIVYSAGYGPKPAVLEAIAPAFPVYFNDGKGKPLTTTTESLISLAKRIGREKEAQQHIALLNTFLIDMKRELSGRARRPLLLMSFIDERHVMIFGKGSLFQDVLDRLEIQNAWIGETGFWGSTIVGIERLADLDNADVICFMDNDETVYNRLSSAPVWNAMPFIRSGQFTRVPVIWFYGGTLTAMRFCQVLDRVLRAA